MKKVGYCRYVHISALNELQKILSKEQILYLKECIEVIKTEKIRFHVVKVDIKTENISFIETAGWNILYEPIIKKSYCFNPKNGLKYKIIKDGKRIYHMKETFISSDYSGFDIEKAIERTRILNSISEIKNNKNRIGNLGYWRELLEKYNLPVYMKI